MLTHINTPMNRFEYERNLYIIAEQMRNGKFRCSSRDYVESFRKVRKLPNKRFDLLTIDETVRLSANMSANFLDQGIFNNIQNNNSPEEHD